MRITLRKTVLSILGILVLIAAIVWMMPGASAKADDPWPGSDAGWQVFPTESTMYIRPDETQVTPTVEWVIQDDTLYIQPTDGRNVGSFGTDIGPSLTDSNDYRDTTSYHPWGTQTYSKIRVKGTIKVGFHNKNGIHTPGANLAWMFGSNDQLTDISGLSHFDVSNAVSLQNIFNGDSALTDFSPIAHWNVKNVTRLVGAFQNTGVTDLTPFANWDVSHVTDMGHIYQDNNGLTQIADGPFSYEYKLTSLHGLENWNVSNVTSANGMFALDSSLNDTSAIEGWDLSNVTGDQTTPDGYDASIFDQSLASNWKKLGVPALSKGGALVANSYYTELNARGDVSEVTSEGNDAIRRNFSSLNTYSSSCPPSWANGVVLVPYIPSWTLSFDPNGGQGSMTPLTTKYLTKATLPASKFFRFGYQFIGWSTQSGDQKNLLQTGSQWAPDGGGRENEKATLYAQWKQIFSGGTTPITGPGGMLPGWVQTGSSGTTGTISTGMTAAASFTNRYEPGSTTFVFHLSKLVDGSVPSTTERYTFNLYDGSGKKIATTQNMGSEIVFPAQSFTSPGSYAFMVSEDTAGIPATMNRDTHVVHFEVDVHPKDSTHAGLWATSKHEGDLTFKNTTHTGALTVKKTVTGTTDTSKQFTVAINAQTSSHAPLSGTYDGLPFTSGLATLSLQAGKSQTITGLPAGTIWTVSEKNIPAGYSLKSITSKSGTIQPDQTETTTVENSYKAQPATAIIQMRKQVLVGPGNAVGVVGNKKYTFTLCEMDTTSTCKDVSNGTATALPDGSITFSPFTYTTPGTHTYKVSETDNHDPSVKYDTKTYQVTVNVADNGAGKLVATVTGNNQTFTNRIPQVGSMPETGRAGVLPFGILCMIVVAISVVMLVMRWD